MPISVKVKSGGYKHFKVPEEIHTYIVQLECAIIRKDFVGIERLYPERFKTEREWDG